MPREQLKKKAKKTKKKLLRDVEALLPGGALRMHSDRKLPGGEVTQEAHLASHSSRQQEQSGESAPSIRPPARAPMSSTFSCFRG